MKFKGILSKRKTWVKVVIFIAALYMIYLEIKTHQWGYVPLTIFVLLACFFDKDQIISEEGVDIEYHLFNKFTRHNYWRWNEITTLHTDHQKAAPNVMLHIGKDIVTRSFVMSPWDCQGAVDLARKMNPNIYIENPTAEEEEQKRRQIIERKNARRRQQKAKKKKR